MFTKEIFRKAVPLAKQSNIDLYFEPLAAAMQKYGINTPLRIAHFIAQLAHESGLFSKVEENLNYSAERLLAVFPKYFTKETAAKYARNPAMIANKVYGNRMGNGNEASGDGYKFRGRGLIGITGKANYLVAGKALGVDLIDNPGLLILPQYAAESAANFWATYNINALADKDDVVAVSKRVNGGVIGLDDRKKQLANAKKAFGIK